MMRKINREMDLRDRMKQQVNKTLLRPEKYHPKKWSSFKKWFEAFLRKAKVLRWDTEETRTNFIDLLGNQQLSHSCYKIIDAQPNISTLDLGCQICSLISNTSPQHYQAKLKTLTRPKNMSIAYYLVMVEDAHYDALPIGEESQQLTKTYQAAVLQTFLQSARLDNKIIKRVIERGCTTGAQAVQIINEYLVELENMRELEKGRTRNAIPLEQELAIMNHGGSGFDHRSDTPERTDTMTNAVNGISKVKLSRPRRETKRIPSEKERNRRALDKVVNECSLEDLTHPAFVGNYDMAKVTCYGCQQKGHMIKQCPRKIKPGIKTPKLSAPVIQAVFEASPAQVRAKKKRGNWNHKGERIYRKNDKGDVYNIIVNSGDEGDDDDDDDDEGMEVNELEGYDTEADPATDMEDEEEARNSLELIKASIHALTLEDTWEAREEPKEVSFSSLRMAPGSTTQNLPHLPLVGWKGPVEVDTGSDIAFCGEALVSQEELEDGQNERLVDYRGEPVKIIGSFELAVEYSEHTKSFHRVKKGATSIKVRVIPGANPLTFGWEQLDQLKLDLKAGPSATGAQDWVILRQAGTHQLLMQRNETVASDRPLGKGGSS